MKRLGYKDKNPCTTSTHPELYFTFLITYSKQDLLTHRNDFEYSVALKHVHGFTLQNVSRCQPILDENTNI